MKLKILFSANDSRSWYICYCISYSWETSQRKKIRQYFLLLKIPYLTINVYSQLNKILSGWNHGSYLFRTFGWISPLYLCQLWYLFNKQRGANINKVHWCYRKSISFQQSCKSLLRVSYLIMILQFLICWPNFTTNMIACNIYIYLRIIQKCRTTNHVDWRPLGSRCSLQKVPKQIRMDVRVCHRGYSTI